MFTKIYNKHNNDPLYGNHEIILTLNDINYLCDNALSNEILKKSYGNGNGNQTRSLCYIDDLISGILKSMSIDFEKPINLGNDKEISLNNLVKVLNEIFGENKVNYLESIDDDPKVRKPDITLAKKILNWKPTINIDEGLKKTINYFYNYK